MSLQLALLVAVPLCFWLVYLLIPSEKRVLPLWRCDRCSSEWEAWELDSNRACPCCGTTCVEEG